MTEEVSTIQRTDLPQDPAFEAMVAAGVFYGRKKSKTNPKMRECIFANRGGIEVIDLFKTQSALEKAMGFIVQTAKAGGLLFIVGTQPMAQKAVQQIAAEFGIPFVTKRWLGGTLTNYKTLSERVAYFKKLRSDLASGALQKYTKKERATFDKQRERLEGLVGGLEHLDRLPTALVVIDPVYHKTAVREANRLRIPVVSLANTDADPDSIAYAVPGNNRAAKSIAWFLEKVAEALREGKAAAPQPAEPQENP